MAKRNLKLPKPFDDLLVSASRRSTLTKTLCAAIYWYWAELTPAEREAALDRIEEIEGHDPGTVKGKYLAGWRLGPLLAGLAQLRRELDALSGPKEVLVYAKQRTDHMLKLVSLSSPGYAKDQSLLDSLLAGGLGYEVSGDVEPPTSPPPTARGKGKAG